MIYKGENYDTKIIHCIPHGPMAEFTSDVNCIQKQWVCKRFIKNVKFVDTKPLKTLPDKVNVEDLR